MPVKHHFPFVAAEPERQGCHGVRMVHVYYVVILVVFPKPSYHCRRNHGGGLLGESINAVHRPMGVEAEVPAILERLVRRICLVTAKPCAQHVTVYALAR